MTNTTHWKFLDIVHYSLQMKQTEQAENNDCVVLHPEGTDKVYDFLCVTANELSMTYIIQEDNRINRVFHPRSEFTKRHHTSTTTH